MVSLFKYIIKQTKKVELSFNRIIFTPIIIKTNFKKLFHKSNRKTFYFSFFKI